jgi:hypothetical protein
MLKKRKLFLHLQLFLKNSKWVYIAEFNVPLIFIYIICIWKALHLFFIAVYTLTVNLQLTQIV